ncbi:putative signal peptide protein [Puccinia sorghi]|uniref:Putative signal peptide protein n=1 Tax=Puccinia sorghi TaxID=27349 RepID=A0A0L6UX97_9BASI|nr:putative signal peptide protein [Puccinia sorghi]
MSFMKKMRLIQLRWLRTTLKTQMMGYVASYTQLLFPIFKNLNDSCHVSSYCSVLVEQLIQWQEHLRRATHYNIPGELVEFSGAYRGTMSITNDYKLSDFHQEIELKELITMIPHNTYKEDYKCVKEVEIDHFGKHDHKEKAQEAILKLNRKLIYNMHLRMHHKFKEKEIKLKYLEMFHFQSKKLYSLKQKKLQLNLKKEDKHKKGKGNEPFRFIEKGSPLTKKEMAPQFPFGKEKQKALSIHTYGYAPYVSFNINISMFFSVFCSYPTHSNTHLFYRTQSVTHMCFSLLLFIRILNKLLLLFIVYNIFISTVTRAIWSIWKSSWCLGKVLRHFRIF